MIEKFGDVSLDSLIFIFAGKILKNDLETLQTLNIKVSINDIIC